MKKLLTLALCAATIASAGAQVQAVKNASKMAGKIDQLNEARSVIKEAIENPETANDAQTYFVAGNIEYDAYDKADALKMINPQDQRVDPLEMGREMLNGYKYYMQALPLDSIPNAKGEVKPKYSKKIFDKINGHSEKYYQAGADFFNNKLFYPEAYEAFMIFGDLPDLPFASNNVKATPDTIRATSYFNAGIAAYSGNELEAAAKAFKKARLNNYSDPECYIYEIACWQNIMARDSLRVNDAKEAISETAQAGYAKFGLSQPLFINNMVNTLVTDGETDKALDLLANLLAENPESPALYGLRGFVYDRNDNDELSVADYLKAASLPDVDYETLKNAAKKVYKVGTSKYNAIDGSTPDIAAAKEDVKNNYFLKSKEITDKAIAMKKAQEGEDARIDSDLQYLIDSIDYALESYF